jgi:hypothetical protein
VVVFPFQLAVPLAFVSISLHTDKKPPAAPLWPPVACGTLRHGAAGRLN